MKRSKLLLVVLFLISVSIACKKDKKDAAKEKVKLYVIADTGIGNASNPIELQLSGTNIETQSKIKSVYILEVDYPKGEVQTLNLKVSSGRTEGTTISLEVSKSVSLNEIEKNRVAYKTSNNGDITLTFVP